MEQFHTSFPSVSENGNIPLPNYDNCLVNLAGSMLSHFGAKPYSPTLPMADRYLSKDYKNVVVLLLDAMGISILEKHLSPDGFFRSHLAGSYSSVFPPTTVAATTSVLSGKFPSETSWLGWDEYFPQLGKNVTVYRNLEQMVEAGCPFSRETESRIGDFDQPAIEEQLPAADFSVGYTYTGYKNICQLMQEAGSRAEFSSPYVEPNPQTLDAILDRVKSLCSEPGKKFIYAYWNEPDGTMHRTGTKSSATHDVITALEKQVEELVSDLSDTLFFITADHGHMDSHNLCILDYPEIVKCLERLPSIEPRSINMFVKEEYKESFPSLFKETFGEKFWLLPKSEVLERKLFGPGTEHPLFRDMIGDYLAVSISDVSLFNTHVEAVLMPGGHAGLTKEELEIPLIVIEKE